MRRFLHSAALGALVLALATPLAAQDAADLRRLALSAELFALGVEEEDPYAVIAAARLRRAFSFERQPAMIDARPNAEQHEPAPPLTEAAAPMDWMGMLDVARELATGDDALLALIDDIEVEADKGVATGQVYAISTIGDGGAHVFDPLPFLGGEYAEVYVESRDGIELNLFIYDEQGRLVCSDTDISSIAYCGWRPARNGSFVIEVKNRGRGGAGYSLMTN